MGKIILKRNVVETWIGNKSTPPNTHDEVAHYLHVSPSLWSLLLSGKRQVTAKLQVKLCELTGYDIGDIFRFEKSK